MWLVCFGFVGFFFLFGSCGRRWWWWDLMFVWFVLGFGGFFFLWVLWPAVVFSGGGGFRYGVDLQWRMLCFLDLGLDAMVWLGFMAGGGSSRSEVREGEWDFGCENRRNHQEGEWESRSVRKKDKKRKV